MAVVGGTLWRESEFQYAPGAGWLTGTCGPNALAMAESWARQQYVSTLSIYQRMRAAGRCAPNGASTIYTLYRQALADGFRAEWLPFQQPNPAFGAFTAARLGQAVIVTEFANGQALRDFLSGKGENATNLHYHFVLLAGYQSSGPALLPFAGGRLVPAGYWVADGDNYATPRGSGPQLNQMQFYPSAVLAAAQPCAALAIYPLHALPERTGQPVWTRNAQGARDDQGHEVGIGFANVIFAQGWEQSNGLMSETYWQGNASVATLDNGHVLDWDGTTVHTDRGAWLIPQLVAALQAARAAAAERDHLAAQVTTLTTAVASDAAQLTQLRAQLAAAQAADDPTALAAVKALKQALASV
jgi:hypothetical protein